MAHHWYPSGDQCLNLRNDALPAFELHRVRATLFEEPTSFAQCLRRGGLVGPKGHVGNHQRSFG